LLFNCLTSFRNILAALLTGIKNRQVDNYYQLEENVSRQTKAHVLDLIKDHEGKGNQPLDKLRFFIICTWEVLGFSNRN